MYTSFFNLKKKPFELVPDPDFIYMSQSHKKALTYLDYGIRSRAGFILLTGEVGSGKTTLIRDLLQKKYDNVVLGKIFNTRVTSEQLLAMINEDFGLSVRGKEKVTLMRELNDFLVEQYARGKQPMLIIDEAQNLGAEVLEEVRMLSNLESSHGKLLQIMLVGQPELRATLASPQLLQLRQRISISCHLKALSREDTEEYIRHRISVAGNAEAVEFEGAGLDLIHKHSRGIPRLINIICDFVMLAAFADGAKRIKAGVVEEILHDLEFEQRYWAIAGGKSAPCASEGVEAVQQELSGQISTALKHVFDSLVLLQEELGTRVGKCEALVTELNARVSDAASKGGRTEAKPLPAPSAPPGFMRRLFRRAGCY